MTASPDDGELIAEIPKNVRECYRVRLGEFKGHRFADVRVFVVDGDERKPTGKGVAIKPEALPAVIAGLQAAQQRFAEPGP